MDPLGFDTQNFTQLPLLQPFCVELWVKPHPLFIALSQWLPMDQGKKLWLPQMEAPQGQKTVSKPFLTKEERYGSHKAFYIWVQTRPSCFHPERERSHPPPTLPPFPQMQDLMEVTVMYNVCQDVCEMKSCQNWVCRCMCVGVYACVCMLYRGRQICLSVWICAHICEFMYVSLKWCPFGETMSSTAPHPTKDKSQNTSVKLWNTLNKAFCKQSSWDFSDTCVRTYPCSALHKKPSNSSGSLKNPFDFWKKLSMKLSHKWRSENCSEGQRHF